jgi:hypothetical protein
MVTNETMGRGSVERAECPVSKLDLVNLVAAFGGVGSSAKSQPTNCALREAGTLRVGDALMVNTRALVGEALRDPGLYSSEDLVEQDAKPYKALRNWALQFYDEATDR